MKSWRERKHGRGNKPRKTRDDGRRERRVKLGDLKKRGDKKRGKKDQERKNNEREEPQNQARSKKTNANKEIKAKPTTHPRRHIHLNHTNNNRSGARKRDIKLIGIK